MKLSTPPLTKPIKSIFIILFCFLSLNMMAQITITESYLTDMYGKKFKEVLCETELDMHEQLEELIAATGENRTWNFADLVYVDSTEIITEIVPISADDPFISDPNFEDAQMIKIVAIPPTDGGLLDTTEQYQYFSLDDGSWNTHGSVTIADLDLDGQLDTFVQWFSPPFEQLQFPVTYLSEFYDSTSINQNFMGMQFTSATIVDSSWVNGYGTLITPNGTGDALRTHNKVITRVPGVPITDITNSLDFVSLDGVSASIVIEDGRAFFSKTTEISGPVSTLDLPDFRFRLNQNYPNPFAGRTTISFSMENADMVQINVLDLTGNKLVRLTEERFPQGNHEIAWSPEDLPGNMYILEMRVGGQIQHRLMGVQR